MFCSLRTMQACVGGSEGRRRRRPGPRAAPLLGYLLLSPEDTSWEGATGRPATTGRGTAVRPSLARSQGPVSWAPHKACCPHMRDESRPRKGLSRLPGSPESEAP